jgi:phosphate transport system substrate-binding protein
VIFRSDESGITDNFQKYLDGASNRAWGRGVGKAFNGGVGEGVKGSSGVSQAIKSTPNSIGYVEWSFAQQDNLAAAQLVTSAGPPPVPLTTQTAAKSIAGVTIKGEGNDLVLDTSTFYMPKETGSYPVMLPTYEIVCSKYPDSEVAPAVKAFLTAALGKGQDGIDSAGYVTVPDAFKAKLTSAAKAIS